MAKGTVSLSVIRRLPRYYRFLRELEENGTVHISSGELAQKMGLTASQIRQDLNCFGGFGLQGYGYNVKSLYEEIGRILGLGTHRRTILIGAGNLGRAITQHMDFTSRGFDLIGIFDADPNLIGRQIGGITIQNSKALYDFCVRNHPTVAILCIPKEAAIKLSRDLVALGIKGFWNFSHYDLMLDYEGIVVENVHLGDSLSILCYRLGELDRENEQPKRKSTKPKNE